MNENSLYYSQQIIKYISKIIVESKMTSKKTKELGSVLIALENDVLLENIKHMDKNFNNDISNDLLYALDLIATYIADIPVMQKSDLTFEERIHNFRTEYMKNKCIQIYNTFKNLTNLDR